MLQDEQSFEDVDLSQIKADLEKQLQDAKSKGDNSKIKSLERQIENNEKNKTIWTRRKFIPFGSDDQAGISYSYGEQKTGDVVEKFFSIFIYDDGSGVKSGVVNFCSDAFNDLQSTFGKATIEKNTTPEKFLEGLFNPNNSKPMGRRQFWLD